MKKQKIIIDTDCGSDDAMAIAMAFSLSKKSSESWAFLFICGKIGIG